MVQIDLLLHGIPGRSSHGYLGQASAALVDEQTMVDVGSLARQPVLKKSFENVDVTPEEVENVVLTHVHFDHADNINLFPNATIHVYEGEMNRLEDGDLDWATPPQAEALFDGHEVSLFDIGDEVAGMEVIAAPGHTEHHVAFILEGEMTYAFTGDAVKNTRELVTLNPMVLYDKEAAIETLKTVRDRVDFVIPGHDTPFYIEDGKPISSVDIDFGVNLQFAPDSATTAQLTSNRSTLKALPEEVNDATARQEFH